MAGLGLVESWWAIAAWPVTILLGAAFAAVGLAASTYMRSYVDFDIVNLAITPMFLFSATFFPLDRYPDAIQAVVSWTPLYQGVVLCRSLVLGDVHLGLVLPLLYLVAMAAAGILIASRRVDHLLRA